MSGAEGAATRARFQTLYTKLVSLRLNQAAIRSAACDQRLLGARMDRQAEIVDRLCDLVAVMGDEHDFRQIDALLAQAEDASCR
ncbi:MAG: hypothetical protein IOC81_14575 [Rhodobacter sp.]|nr:hypothetical protein [Rhodobacter sp.]MCA3467487.1 hypothetical protein [Rhodobacter sp.]MCA3491726.1 hypothetical protein [Rhodobacter sp.]